jgi:DNA end-binding protein Ku
VVRTVLALHTLYFADEVRDPGELDHVPGRRRASGADKELDMATGLIESMSAPWRPERYRDSYRDRVRKLIEDKRARREVVTESEAPEPTDMSDLLEALQRSVEAARGRAGVQQGPARKSRGRKPRGRKAGGRKAPDLDSATKQQLLEMARERNVSGRSSMNRDQLVAALRRAS